MCFVFLLFTCKNVCFILELKPLIIRCSWLSVIISVKQYRARVDKFILLLSNATTKENIMLGNLVSLAKSIITLSNACDRIYLQSSAVFVNTNM